MKAARHAFVGARGVDSVQAITTQAQAQALKDSGIDFCIRYLGGTSSAEVDLIIAVGLAFMPVTYSRAPGWLPSAQLGTLDGNNAASHCIALGLPKGATVWLDLEGPGGHSQDIIDWVTAWCLPMKAAGYDCGLYVGYGTQLTSHELYALPVDRYWHSISRVTDSAGQLAEPQCGWCMYQLQPSRMWANTWVDVDCVQEDYQGRLPTWTVKG